MFDVSEGPDKLVSGYTLYERHTRAWPPHNHTNQGDLHLITFVHSIKEADLVTIPFLNYRPACKFERKLLRKNTLSAKLQHARA